MKLRDYPLVGQREGPILNQEIIRARAIIAELKLNTQRAHELTHTLRNLLTVRRLMLEEFHRRWNRSH
jgi:signal transduction histidine kinase